MLSIIISSYQPHYYSALQANIAETCGVVFEIIKIENPGLMGLCDAYNKGAESARYDHLLFLHEDVLFETYNWGIKLVDFLGNQNVGCVGLAGSSYIPFVPHKWWKNKIYSFDNVLQLNNDQKQRSKEFTEHTQKVYSLDGVFIACRKKVYQEFLFNRELRTYHGYDIDFSIRVSTKYNNYIINELDLFHFSGGNANKEWFRQIIKTRNFYSIPKNQKNDRTVEVSQYILFGENVFRFCDTKTEAILLLMKYFSLSKMGLRNVKICLKFCYYILQK